MMLSVPKSRRWLLPAIVLFALVLSYRLIGGVPSSVKTAIRFGSPAQIHHGIKISPKNTDHHRQPRWNASQKQHSWPKQNYYYSFASSSAIDHAQTISAYLKVLLECRQKPNPYTDHIRLPNIIQNVS
jgi:hypothetical protein